MWWASYKYRYYGANVVCSVSKSNCEGSQTQPRESSMLECSWQREHCISELSVSTCPSVLLLMQMAALRRTFTQPWDLSDVSFAVQGRYIYANKTIMSMWLSCRCGRRCSRPCSAARSERAPRPSSSCPANTTTTCSNSSASSILPTNPSTVCSSATVRISASDVVVERGKTSALWR